MHKPQENNRIQFYRECAEQWRSHARGARSAESQEARLQMAIVWENMAEQLESSPVRLAIEPSKQPEIEAVV